MLFYVSLQILPEIKFLWNGNLKEKRFKLKALYLSSLIAFIGMKMNFISNSEIQPKYSDDLDSRKFVEEGGS